MQKFLKGALITSVSILTVSGVALAGTIEGAVTADNDFIVYLSNNSSHSTVYESNNGRNWNNVEQFDFNVEGTAEELRRCTVNIIAWGDGSINQGMAGILKGDMGTVYTGSGQFRSGQSSIASGGWANANAGPTQITNIINSSPQAPAASFNGTVTGGTSPWGSLAFPAALLSGVDQAKFKWVWPSTASSDVRRKVYSVFRIPCGELVKPKEKPQDPPPVPKGDHFQCYLLNEGERVKPETITIEDQFGRSRVVLGRPKMLCNPSSKIHRGKEYGVEKKERHLVCYEYLEQDKVKKQNLFINTQFGDDKVTSTKRQLFCAPAGKAHLKKGENVDRVKPTPRNKRQLKKRNTQIE